MKRTIIALVLALGLLLVPSAVSAASDVVIDKIEGEGTWADDTWQVQIFPGETKSTTITFYNSSSSSLQVEATVSPYLRDNANVIFTLVMPGDIKSVDGKLNFTMPGKSYSDLTLNVYADASTTPGTYTTELEIKSEVPPSGGGGGGGGGGGPRVYYLEVDLWGEEFTVPITYDGQVQEDREAVSSDGMLTIRIAKDVVALTGEGKRLKEIEVWPVEQPPSLPEDKCIIGTAYDFAPDGATFDEPIEVEMHYDPSQIPDDVDEEDLIIAYYDEEAGEWVECECTCDPANQCVTACICHLSSFAVIGTIILPPPPPPPAPADFSISSLNIFPDKIDVGGSVTISVLVTNTGGQVGSYEVVLRIDGVVEKSKGITLDAGAGAPVTFNVSKDTAGTYSVDVNGLTGSFTVKEVAAPVKPINWPLIGGIIAAVVVIGVGLGVFFWMRRKPSRVLKQRSHTF